jgi:hypothetical protein
MRQLGRAALSLAAGALVSGALVAATPNAAAAYVGSCPATHSPVFIAVGNGFPYGVTMAENLRSSGQPNSFGYCTFYGNYVYYALGNRSSGGGVALSLQA